ncbi:hypothetical protein C8F04DRAFT_1065834 [Mycena alexandri]|uniref:P-loop containing nucleoside triphosphate hydrolase protein n=1 Tax=Mycena alexandri TaxID=1745969 RepID=A0AAD6XF49_9AGAR|nr:hypothetical protein C8F04DRAFT_1065834 [Mycena alexandri]
MSRPQCRFYNKPGGCRRGDQCTFSHEHQLSQPPASPAAARRGPLPNAPAGVCNIYWSAGNCRWEFKCRYRHTLNPSLSPSSPSPEWPPSPTTPNPLAPFLTEAGLAKLNAPGTDVFFPPPAKPMSPNEIHNHLKKFLRDDFRFDKTYDIYSFLIPLASIDASGPHWAPEDGPLLLSSLATGNGLLRIGDIFQWSSVSSSAGSSRSELSFQRGYIPLLKFYSSDFVVKSTLNHLVNGLYMRILDGSFNNWCTNLDKCMQEIMAARSFRDVNQPASSTNTALGGQVISSLTVVFFEILTRFKNASATYPNLVPIVRNLKTWTETWIEGISMSSFDDPFKEAGPSTRDQITSHLRAKVDRLVAIVDREQGRIDRASQQRIAAPFPLPDRSHEGVVAALNITYEGPGPLRAQGPRHDNDFADIADIRVVPTHEELTCRISPFLPGNFHDAPHHLPVESMERLLDIQFRLLREELTAPLRTSVQLVREDLQSTSSRPTILSHLLKTRGGKYKGHTPGQEQALFNVYTNVSFLPLVPDWRGLSVGLSVDAPPGRARQSQSKARVAFWEGASGKRLIQGGLVALVWQRGNKVEVHLGIVASSLNDLKESAKQWFFSDPAVEVRILNILKNHDPAGSTGTKVLVESSVMFESIRPFLEALRMEPENLPFSQYLVHRSRDFLSSLNIAPPRYALVPGFTYQLASLFPPQAGIVDLKLDVTDPTSIASVRTQLKTSRLDASQCEAVVATLTRELAMIQGPPGTGKSYTGVEILRVLLANNIRPILMIAFTNHALDHMLTSVLDAGITKKFVRLGSRSADERISKYSMDTIEMVAGKSRLDRSFGHHYRELKNVEDEIKKLMKTFVAANITSSEFESYLEIQYGEHHEHLYLCPPSWIQILRVALHDDEGEGSPWMQAGKHGKVEIDDDSMYAFWRKGRDLDFLDSSLQQHAEYELAVENRNRFSALEAVEEEKDQGVQVGSEGSSTDAELTDSDDEDDIEEEIWQKDWPILDTKSDSDVPFKRSPPSRNAEPSPSERSISPVQVADLKDPRAFFGGSIPSIPNSDRPLDSLLAEGTMWSFSRRERGRLNAYWSAQIRERLHEDQLQDFQSLRSKHESVLKKYQEGKDEIRRSLLNEIDIVGCTTTGAAKLTSLLKSLAPRVMLVEEAGQVLEAHILGSLVPSVEQLILIGDPLQLRPTLNNYSLSMDNPRGKQLFKFDMSLMERLASNGLAMSQINVQRRMRPAISSLIRNTLYPKLEDHKLVKLYRDVRGFRNNVFFFSHTHRENDGAEESSSKYNTFEVDMIKDLVLYLLRQGYSDEGDIVVLCAYLGQLARVRDALRNEVAVIIDGRDKENLAEQEEEIIEDRPDQSQVEQVQVTKRVRLRTVDNYQGEEAKIVILSTVRNAGSKNGDLDSTPSYGRPTIGFLVSENRTNVALSRAKEGLFILGNAGQLASRSKMWCEVIEQLESADCIGTAFPVSCHQHPDKVEMISKPGTLPLFAPDGGCLEPCNFRLKCGHVCHYKCHPDDPGHIAVSCPQPCRRLCARKHPCPKRCSEDCGECRFPVRDIELPCGHTASSIECHRLDNLDDFFCTVLVKKNFPTCEHSADMMCSSDPSEAQCTHTCDGVMSCCGRSCNSKCSVCQRFNEPALGPIDRIQHDTHPCEKNLYCGHTCGRTCSRDHECATTCQKQCRQRCSHSECQSYCSTPCSPCMKECTWDCPHQAKKCPLPCGSVCARLPCDEPCPNSLRCGHKCPSVCGEDCSIQMCHVCAPENRRKDVVDLILYRTLDDVEPTLGGLDELLITLPACKHVFTVESLDGICELQQWYSSVDGKWVGLQSPDSGGKTRAPPACPTCREAITSPRYGRVFKSADLEILERNIISSMTRNLNKLHVSMSGISPNTMVEALNRETARLSIPSTSSSTQKQRKVRARARRKVLSSTRDLPVPLGQLLPSAGLHDVSAALANLWKRTTRNLTDMYANAMKVAATRSAHAQAWEAAFSCLYDKEMEMAVADPARAPRRPQEHAMRMARMKVGQLQPRADKRFLVEAFWATLQLRFILGDLARTWMSELLDKKGDNFSTEERQKWGSFGLFLFDSCLRDAEQAYSIAEQSESRRQMTKSVLFTMRARLNRFTFNLEMVRASSKMQEARAKLLDDVEREKFDAERDIATTVEKHIARLPDDRQTWIRDNFSETADVVVSEWMKMEKSIRSGTFHQPVTFDEQRAVVQALNFSHTGHFYKCPQGHVYVIGECGGAVERTRCPECGSPCLSRSLHPHNGTTFWVTR